jgi:hypothetical protein
MRMPPAAPARAAPPAISGVLAFDAAAATVCPTERALDESVSLDVGLALEPRLFEVDLLLADDDLDLVLRCAALAFCERLPLEPELAAARPFGDEARVFDRLPLELRLPLVC